MNMGDLTANHASIYSKKKKGFYINKHQYLFSQVTLKNLSFVKLNDEFQKTYKEINKAGFFIHQYLHSSKAKPNAILKYMLPTKQSKILKALERRYPETLI